MAVLIPPSKLRSLDHSVSEPEAKITQNIVVQFVSEDDGKPLAPTVSLPANVSREGLETLVNKLKSQVCYVLFVFREYTGSLLFIPRDLI